MTAEQLHWATKQFWFEGSGQDSQDNYVIGRDSNGSRPALVFHDFIKLTEWAAGQRDNSVGAGSNL